MSDPHAMVRLKDIAERARVSVMTVSKVLRDAPDISAATKVRVRKLARDMGYVPDTAARGLRSRTSHLFGLVVSAATNPLFARTFMALEQKAHELGYEILLAHSLNQPEREEEVLRRLLARRIDGLFLAPVYRLEPSAPIYRELARRKLPTVLLGHPTGFCQEFASVAADDLAASYTATRHLIQLGHKRIAFLAGLPSSPSAQERLEGYRRALREADLPLNDQLIFKAGSTIQEGEQAALQLLQEQPHATAIQGVNDLTAIGAANVLLNHGLHIPQNLSVIGFGNILISETFRVPLTTLREPKFQLGLAAIDLMSRLLKGDSPSPVRMPAELVIRQSTAPPPSPA